MIYIEIIQGTPLLMVVFWFYFLAPVVFGRTLPEASAHCPDRFHQRLHRRNRARRRRAYPKARWRPPEGSGLSHIADA